MERRGSDTSDSGSTSSSDLYASEPAHDTRTSLAHPQVVKELDDSEMDSEDSSEEEETSTAMDLSPVLKPTLPTLTSAGSGQATGSKRKFDDTADGAAVVTDAESNVVKKAKPTTDALDHGLPQIYGLPPIIWQQVFCRVSPLDLVRLPRVCKTFALYLSRTRREATLVGAAQMLDRETIWTNSRRNTLPSIPRPLMGVSEFDMFKLIFSENCQFCGRLPAATPPSTPLTAGPGENGVRVIWPFHIRSCAACLSQRILRDTEILQHHPTFRDLRLGVPYALWTAQQHFIPDSIRHDHPEINAQLSVLKACKVFYKDNLASIAAEYQDAKHLGDGAAEEWRKGLPAEGKTAMSDCARWEKWEDQKIHRPQSGRSLRDQLLSLLCSPSATTKSRSIGISAAQPPVVAHGAHPLPVRPVYSFDSAPEQLAPYNQSFSPQTGYGYNPYQTQNPGLAYISHNSSAMTSPVGPTAPGSHLSRATGNQRARGPEEVEAARQARKAEIERRCLLLQPPISSSVLQHIPSFQHAMQIAMPMTDEAWRILEPKIASQREDAELKEHHRLQDLAALQAAVPTTLTHVTNPKAHKESNNQQYQQAQQPLRNRLAEYADDCINGRWAGGTQLTETTAPHFAVQVLLHVQKRYEEDKALGLLPATIPSTSFLSLDNMKWVYENKVRSFIERGHRNIWICARCVEANGEKQDPKMFEGLIQHYGSVHSSAFGQDNVAVRWQSAHWPQEPPFHTDPGRWTKQTRSTNGSSSRGHELNSHAGTSSHAYSSNTLQPQQSREAHATGTYSLPLAETDGPADREALVESLATVMRTIWDVLDDVKDLLSCIRVQTAIYHGAAHAMNELHSMPDLDLFADVVANHALMRPVKAASNLTCKRCEAKVDDSYYARLARAQKHYHLSALVTHFRTWHASDAMNWTQMMLDVPENAIVRELLSTPGMDDDKLSLIASAFPKAFPHPLPKIGVITEEVGVSNTSLAGNVLGRLTKRQRARAERRVRKANEAREKLESGNGRRSGDQTAEAAPEANDVEYDPRRPMLKKKSPDLSRFDTDISRKVSGTDQHSTSQSLAFSPETLAALQNTSANNRSSRSPSVGARSSRPATAAAQHAPTPGVQPDITAILAALTGKPQGGSPLQRDPSTMHGSAGTSITPQRAYQDRYTGPPPAVSQDPSPMSGWHELQASLHSGSRPQEHAPYAAQFAAYQPAPATQYANPPAYAHPAAYAPAPVQYVEFLDRGRHVEYPQPARPAQPFPLMGIDERGVPFNLIPLDAPSQPSRPTQLYATDPYGQGHPAAVYSTMPPGEPGAYGVPTTAAAPGLHYEQGGPGHVMYDNGSRPAVSRY